MPKMSFKLLQLEVSRLTLGSIASQYQHAAKTVRPKMDIIAMADFDRKYEHVMMLVKECDAMIEEQRVEDGLQS